MTRRSLLLLALTAIACGARPAPTPQSAHGSAAVSLAPAHGLVAGPRPAQKLEVPASPNAEHVELLESVCALAWLPDEHGKVTVGCTSHPPFVQREQLPSGDVPRFPRDRMDLCTVAAVYRGSFSRPGAPQAVVAFDECHDVGDSFGSSSFFSRSILLLERVDGRWEATSYEEAKDASDCRVRNVPNERDALVCRSRFAATRGGQITYLYTVDFGKEKDSRIDTFARLYDNLFECEGFEQSKWRLDYGFVTLKTNNFAVLADTGSVVLDVQRSRLAHSASLAAAKLCAECTKRSESDGNAIAARPETNRLTFVPRGHSFVPDAKTERLVEA